MIEPETIESEVEENLPTVSDSGHSVQANALPKIPTFRRDLNPSNVSLSSEDIAELYSVISECNDRAKELELNGFDLSQTTAEEARQKVAGLWPCLVGRAGARRSD